MSALKGEPAPGLLPTTLYAIRLAIVSHHEEELRSLAKTQILAESAKDVGQLVEYLKAGPSRRALVVGHSQGTLFANTVFELAQMAQRNGLWNIPANEVGERIRIVNIGAAAASVAGQTLYSSPPQYVTSSHDAVILMLRGASAYAGLSAPLAANTNSSYALSAPGASTTNSDFAANHGFVSTYLNDTTASYPALRLLENVLLEDVRVGALGPSERIDVEMDIYSPVPQSTSFGGSTISPAPPLVLSGPWNFGDMEFPIRQPAGTTTYAFSYWIPCAPKASLNMRPDHPNRALDVFGARPTFHVYSQLAPVTMVAARLRTSTTGGAASPWQPLTPPQMTSVEARHQTFQLFSYNSVISPRGVSMHLAQ